MGTRFPCWIASVQGLCLTKLDFGEKIAGRIDNQDQPRLHMEGIATEFHRYPPHPEAVLVHARFTGLSCSPCFVQPACCLNIIAIAIQIGCSVKKLEALHSLSLSAIAINQHRHELSEHAMQVDAAVIAISTWQEKP